jgi:NAD(P)-dependent dehydrogenase (short-subunit alcohol dehydrogenase family)
MKWQDSVHKKRDVASGVTGPKITEGLVRREDYKWYGRKMVELWGGPAPVHYEQHLQQWVASGLQVTPRFSRTAFVTGGAAGIGFFVSKALSSLGYRIVLATRAGLEYEVEGAADSIREAVPDAQVVIPKVHLDLGSFNSVREFVASLDGSIDALDVLCCNAGRGGSKGDKRQMTKDGQESIVQINAISHFLLISELLPLLQKSSDAKIISQSSGARKNYSSSVQIPQRIQFCFNAGSADGIYNAATYNAWTQYQLSKACNCVMTWGLNKRLQRHSIQNITALVCGPGFACSGVNIQHNLGHSHLGVMDGLLPTNTMHDIAGHHVADGALPMVLAAITKAAPPNSFFQPIGGMKGKPELASQASLRSGENGSNDPMNEESKDWDREQVGDGFWKQANEATGAKWPWEESKMD